MKKILVIDDSPDILKSICEHLKRNQFEPVPANNGREAMELYNSEIAVVIIDLLMPEKDGITTIRELKKRNPQIKIIAISAMGDFYLKGAKMYGAAKTFVKPFDYKQLMEAVKELQ